jgi:hypothetical protein
MGITLAAGQVRVWRLAGPIMIANLSTPLLGAVDTAVVGHLPDPAYIGGVALGSMIFSFLFWGFGFLRMGTAGFAAQAFGSGDGMELRATLARPLLLALGLGVALILLRNRMGRPHPGGSQRGGGGSGCRLHRHPDLERAGRLGELCLAGLAPGHPASAGGPGSADRAQRH